MTYKRGESGNRAGRPKGVPNRRTELAKLIDPHAPALIARAIALANDGDVQALRLVLERILPKVGRESTGITLPATITEKTLPKVKRDILAAAIEGRISISDANALNTLLDTTCGKSAPTPKINFLAMTPTEAAKAYMAVMRGEV